MPKILSIVSPLALLLGGCAQWVFGNIPDQAQSASGSSSGLVTSTTLPTETDGTTDAPNLTSGVTDAVSSGATETGSTETTDPVATSTSSGTSINESSTSTGDSDTSGTTGVDCPGQPGCPDGCGDGEVNAPEQCDDGPKSAIYDGCFQCKYSLVAFVSSKPTLGAIKATDANDVAVFGIEAANIKCQKRAGEQDLKGTYHAWLSYQDCFGNLCAPAHPASENVPLSTYGGRFVLPNGAELAQNWDKLVTGNLSNPFNIDESGTPRSGFAWTNTGSGGSLHDWSTDCWNWTMPDVPGAVGDISQVSEEWTLAIIDMNGKNTPLLKPCADAHHLYCFQVKL